MLQRFDGVDGTDALQVKRQYSLVRFVGTDELAVNNDITNPSLLFLCVSLLRLEGGDVTDAL